VWSNQEEEVKRRMRAEEVGRQEEGFSSRVVLQVGGCLKCAQVGGCLKCAQVGSGKEECRRW
jgi:hypothetical protein